MNISSTELSIVLGVLLGVSEALSLIPVVKANGIFQLILMVLQKLTGTSPVSSVTPPTTPPAA